MLRTLFFPVSIALDVGLFELYPTELAAKVVLVASVLLTLAMWLAAQPPLPDRSKTPLTDVRRLLLVAGYHFEMLHHRFPRNDFLGRDLNEKSVLLLRSAEQLLDNATLPPRNAARMTEKRQRLMSPPVPVVWALMIMAIVLWIAVTIGRR